MPTLPPYQNTAQFSQAPGLGDTSYLNSGNLGFFNLPVERTIGGFENNIWANPQPTKIFDPKTNKINELPFNPFLQGAITGGQDNPTFTPYLPDKIVYKSPSTNLGPIPGGGGASQWINGKQYNVNGNNYEYGKTEADPYHFGTSAGTVSQEAQTPFNGFHFGQQGQPGYKFMSGAFDQGKFLSNQPASLNPAPQQGLGTFKPWNPSLDALQQSRSQP